jgi:hypothetical protein
MSKGCCNGGHSCIDLFLSCGYKPARDICRRSDGLKVGIEVYGSKQGVNQRTETPTAGTFVFYPWDDVYLDCLTHCLRTGE